MSAKPFQVDTALRKTTRPRVLTDAERAAIEPFLEKVHYSPRYDGIFCADIDTRMMSLNTGKAILIRLIRHVTLPKDTLKVIPKDYFDPETGALRLLQEAEWRSLGITQVRRLQRQLMAECWMASL
jgi:cyclin-dependent kinase regulatory subunit CKS1